MRVLGALKGSRARALRTGEREGWEKARSTVNSARSLFYESARRDLQIRGGNLPGPIDFEARLRRLGGHTGENK